MADIIEGYDIVSTDVVTVKNDIGIYQDFEVTHYKNNKGQDLFCLEPHIEMPCKLPTDFFPPNNYKVTNG